MQQIFVQQPVLAGSVIIPDEQQAHHLSHVLRMKEGELLRVVDPEGKSGLGEMITVDPVKLRIVELFNENKELSVPVTLAAALIKGERWDWLLQKCTELGVSRIIPFESSRTVVKISGEKTGKKQQRWQKIVQEAAQQCKRTQIPEVTEPVSLKEAAGWLSDQNFVAYENAELRGGQLHRLLQPGQSATLVIGPEGGFSEDEIQWLIQQGYRCCSLGKRILRAETAAVYAMCAADFVLEEESEC